MRLPKVDMKEALTTGEFNIIEWAIMFTSIMLILLVVAYIFEFLRINIIELL